MRHKLLTSSLFAAVLVALASTAMASTTWYVNGVSGSDSNTCTSPTTAITDTYTVNPDCTGSTTATPGSGGDNFAFVIVNGGAEILATDISAPDTLSLDFKKQ